MHLVMIEVPFIAAPLPTESENGVIGIGFGYNERTNQRVVTANCRPISVCLEAI